MASKKVTAGVAAPAGHCNLITAVTFFDAILNLLNWYEALIRF